VRKCPLAALLVERGIFESADEARHWVMAGQVLVNDQRIDKPGMTVPCDAMLRVRRRHRYASRGGYKLEAALEHFDVNVAGCVALDSGASTGGFTDCLLQHKAALVYAVEVGYGQLVGRLRADPRVRNLERTNISDLISTPTINRVPTPPSLITLDLSYLSLTKALPIAAALLAPAGQVLALLKPLFEVESAEARRNGQVDDPALLVAALHSVLAAGVGAGLVPLGAAKLALQPRHGVTEFFVFFGRNANHPPFHYDDTILMGIVEGPGIGDTVIPCHPSLRSGSNKDAKEDGNGSDCQNTMR
jgi:23S rRNA (cytidine1920-2'-O)/16S rRNA (cytidine1409-2'-O)-methyltransferase